MNFFRREFLTDIDFRSARVIQGLILNLNLYLLTFYIVYDEYVKQNSYNLNRNPWMGYHYADLVGEFHANFYQSNQE